MTYSLVVQSSSNKFLLFVGQALKILSSLNKESGPFFPGDRSICSFGGAESHFSLAIVAFGAFEFIVPKYPHRLDKVEIKSPESFI